MTQKIVVLLGVTFSLHVWVKDDLSPYKPGESNYQSGFIECNYTDMLKKYYDWDNLEWFLDLTKDKKEELKADFIKEPPKGWFKELKALINEAKELQLL